MKARFLRLLQQPTTWRGLVLIATALGAQLQPDLQEVIISIGLSIVGVLLVKDDNTPQKPIEP
jgi:hypothetical protein